MIYFAKLGIGSKVLTVEAVHNNIATTEQAGINFLNNLYGTNDVWKQTFTDGTRKNYAGVGYKYDQTRDAFIPSKPYISWILNETTCLWEAPVIKPDDGQRYSWNEETQQWDLNEQYNKSKYSSRYRR